MKEKQLFWTYVDLSEGDSQYSKQGVIRGSWWGGAKVVPTYDWYATEQHITNHLISSGVLPPPELDMRYRIEICTNKGGRIVSGVIGFVLQVC
jgi:hypothetical protein